VNRAVFSRRQAWQAGSSDSLILMVSYHTGRKGRNFGTMYIIETRHWRAKRAGLWKNVTLRYKLPVSARGLAGFRALEHNGHERE
jgi:hypothetical protein